MKPARFTLTLPLSREEAWDRLARPRLCADILEGLEVFPKGYRVFPPPASEKLQAGAKIQVQDRTARSRYVWEVDEAEAPARLSLCLAIRAGLLGSGDVLCTFDLSPAASGSRLAVDFFLASRFAPLELMSMLLPARTIYKLLLRRALKKALLTAKPKAARR